MAVTIQALRPQEFVTCHYQGCQELLQTWTGSFANQGFLCSKEQGGVSEVKKGKKRNSLIPTKNNEGVEENPLPWWSVPDKA